MARKEELQQMKVRDLKSMATKLGIKGSWDMKKDEVVEAILEVEEARDLREKTTAFGDEATKGYDEGTNDAAVEAAEEENAKAKKLGYVENVAVGTIVAFRCSNGKVRSAKVKAKSTYDRKLKLVTSYGMEYIVDFSDVIWVRTGKRWPKGVYNLLKGLRGDEASVDAAESKS